MSPDATDIVLAGPKLFVTPSQKSNRHIIVNAISHRCLAGTVNQEVKNRVLEVGAGLVALSCPSSVPSLPSLQIVQSPTKLMPGLPTIADFP